METIFKERKKNCVHCVINIKSTTYIRKSQFHVFYFLPVPLLFDGQNVFSYNNLS
jgi:hypothetical protein